MATSFESMLKAAEESKQANLVRYNQAMAIYDEVINRYQPGGAFEKSALSDLETRRTVQTGKEKQDLISSGLFGTTAYSGVGSRFEQNVASPFRLKLEDIQLQRLSQAQIGKAGFLERVEDTGPSYSDLFQAGQASAGGGGGGTTTQRFGTQGSGGVSRRFGATGNISGGAGGTTSTVGRESTTPGGDLGGSTFKPGTFNYSSTFGTKSPAPAPTGDLGFGDQGTPTAETDAGKTGATIAGMFVTKDWEAPREDIESQLKKLSYRF